ncbi:DNA topoisomerase IB [Shimia ponticola]|uniref:DNA topoisomerase IB n=1 Tax=Shimia ponticola TaxID=2582893 RepID=UPI0011BF9C77|nr:DNA topoisomerase IB [Shimia ponticola]
MQISDLPPSLTYYPDDRPGITRRRAGRGWSYRAPDGTRIDDTKERERLNALAVPPAYSDVWISPKTNGHLQATGLDARTRKQYRYHPDWTAHRAAAKFDNLADFGAALPALRRRIHKVLTDGHTDTPDFAIAACLRLIDGAALRVGTPDYAEENETYGATTLRTEHVTLGRDGIAVSYTGKGGQSVDKTLKDATLQKALEELESLSGAELMAYETPEGTRSIGPDQVNDWLRDATGASNLTAKTFRTWAGSVAAMDVALREPSPTITAMAEAAATRLHNTPTIARNSYIHPSVIALCDADVPEVPSTPSGLRRAERALMMLL